MTPEGPRDPLGDIGLKGLFMLHIDHEPGGNRSGKILPLVRPPST